MSFINPTLAVVIPNFNYGRFLPQTLESVLSQTEPFDEIVVVDDGSTDDSLDVLSNYAPHVRVLRIENSGQLGACRAGLEATTSDYVYTLDADDYAARTLVSRVRAALRDRPAKVQFQLAGVDSTGRSTNSAFPTYPANYDAAAMRRDNAAGGFYICPPTSGNVYSRDVLSKIDLSRFDPRGVIDGSPTLALPYFGEIVSINEPLACYRMHGNSMSTWSKPSVELLERELFLFSKSWNEVLDVVEQGCLRSPAHRCTYVQERRLMIACLAGRLMVVRPACGFAAGVLRTNLPPRQKIIFIAWAAVLMVPSAGLRHYLIRMKRSSVNRPRAMQTFLNRLLGVRRPAT